MFIKFVLIFNIQILRANLKKNKQGVIWAVESPSFWLETKTGLVIIIILDRDPSAIFRKRKGILRQLCIFKWHAYERFWTSGSSTYGLHMQNTGNQTNHFLKKFVEILEINSIHLIKMYNMLGHRVSISFQFWDLRPKTWEKGAYKKQKIKKKPKR